MSYNIQLPTIKERIKWGNDIIGFIVLDIATETPGGISRQREIRLGISPLQFEITHHSGQLLKFGLSISNFALRWEIQYGNLEKI